MHPSAVLRVLVCVTLLCLQRAVSSKGSAKTSLKGFREDYSSVAKTCRTVGFVKDHCRTRTGASVIAFHAQMTSHQSRIGAGTVLKFPKVTLNEGGGYDAQSSVFTAPVKGVYVFDWTVLTQSGKHCYSALHANGKDIAKQHCNADSTWRLCSTMGIAKMEKGEKAWIRIFHANDNYAYGNYLFTYVNGFKL